jgi:hypothetical protein
MGSSNTKQTISYSEEFNKDVEEYGNEEDD